MFPTYSASICLYYYYYSYILTLFCLIINIITFTVIIRDFIVTLLLLLPMLLLLLLLLILLLLLVLVLPPIAIERKRGKDSANASLIGAKGRASGLLLDATCDSYRVRSILEIQKKNKTANSFWLWWDELLDVNFCARKFSVYLLFFFFFSLLFLSRKGECPSRCAN